MLKVSATSVAGSEPVSNVSALPGVEFFCNCHCSEEIIAVFNVA